MSVLLNNTLYVAAPKETKACTTTNLSNGKNEWVQMETYHGEEQSYCHYNFSTIERNKFTIRYYFDNGTFLESTSMTLGIDRKEKKKKIICKVKYLAEMITISVIFIIFSLLHCICIIHKNVTIKEFKF